VGAPIVHVVETVDVDGETVPRFALIEAEPSRY